MARTAAFPSGLEFPEMTDSTAVPRRVVVAGSRRCPSGAPERVPDEGDHLAIDDHFSRATWLLQRHTPASLSRWIGPEQRLPAVRHVAEEVTCYSTNLWCSVEGMAS